MKSIRRIISVLLVAVMLLSFAPAGVFDVQVSAAPTNTTRVEVSSWDEITDLLDTSDNGIKNKEIVLLNDITMPAQVGHVASYSPIIFETNDSIIDGNGYKIILPDDFTIYKDVNKPGTTHPGLSLFGSLDNSIIKNLMVVAMGDVHIGGNYGSDYDGRNSSNIPNVFYANDVQDVGLLTHSLKNTTIENVAIVGNQESSTLHFRRYNEGTDKVVRAGILTGNMEGNINIDGLYIDMNINAGVSQNVRAYTSVGLVAGRTKYNTETILTMDNFQLQGDVTGYSGSGYQYVNVGGVIGFIDINSTVKATATLTNGIIDVSTGAYDFYEYQGSAWKVHGGNGYEGGVVGNLHIESIGDQASLSGYYVHLKHTTKPETYENGGTHYNENNITNHDEFPTVPSIGDLQVWFNSNPAWVTGVSDTLGNVALKWLVSPENEGFSLAVNNTNDALVITADTPQKGRSNNSWTISGTVPLRGKFKTIDTVTVNESSTQSITGVEVPTTSVDADASNVINLEAGSSYAFTSTVNTDNLTAGEIEYVWSLENVATNDLDGGALAAGDRPSINADTGILTIPTAFVTASNKSFAVKLTATHETDSAITKSETVDVTVVLPSVVSLDSSGAAMSGLATEEGNQHHRIATSGESLIAFAEPMYIPLDTAVQGIYETAGGTKFSLALVSAEPTLGDTDFDHLAPTFANNVITLPTINDINIDLNATTTFTFTYDLLYDGKKTGVQQTQSINITDRAVYEGTPEAATTKFFQINLAQATADAGMAITAPQPPPSAVPITTDNNQNPVYNITSTAAPHNQGTVQYSTDSGTSWSTTFPISTNLSGGFDLRVRQIPQTGNDAEFSYVASDETRFEITAAQLATAFNDPLVNTKTFDATSGTNAGVDQEYDFDFNGKIVNYTDDGTKAEGSISLNELTGGTAQAAYGFGAGEIRVNFGTGITKYNYRDITFETGIYTLTLTTSGGVPRPVIRTTGNSYVDGVSITVPSGTTVYYTTDGNDPTTLSAQYQSPIKITDTTTIKAISVNAEGDISSISEETITYQAFSQPPQPAISSVKDGATSSDYSPTRAYNIDTVISLQEPTLDWQGSTKIYYTFEVPSSAAEVVNGTLYAASTNQPTLTTAQVGSREYVTLYTVSVVEFGSERIISDVASFRFNIYGKADISRLVANRNPNDTQLPGTTLYLSLPESEYSLISADNIDKIDSYDAAVAADNALIERIKTESNIDVDVDYITRDSQQDVTRYITYERTADRQVDLPQLYYYTVQGTVATPPTEDQLTEYDYATREVKYTYSETGTLEAVDVTYQLPDRIAITGAAGQAFTVYAQLRPTGTVASRIHPSDIIPFEYTIAEQIQAVTMLPDPTSADSVFNESTQISLSTKTPDVIIYYSLSGIPNNIQYTPHPTDSSLSGTWEIQDPPAGQEQTTFRYGAPFLLNSTDPVTTLYTYAVSTNNSKQAISNQFQLNVTPLPQAESPTPVLASGATVVSGQQLRFTTTLVSGDIYYTIDGGTPDIAAYKQWFIDNPTQNVAPNNNVNGTYKYSSSLGITAEFQDGESVFTIIAVAEDTGTPKEYSTSPPVRVDYIIQAAQTPTSIPESAVDNIPVVEPGTTIRLLSSTPNAQIFFTTDSTEPSITATTTTDPATGNVSVTYSPTAGTTTRRYTADDFPVMPSGTQSFYTVRAIAVAEDYVESAEALLMFQPPAEVYPVSPNVSHLQPIAQNTAVSLTTATPDARIIFKLYDTLEAAQADTAQLSDTNGTLYNESAPIVISENTVIRAVAEKSNVQSAEAFYSYTVAPQLAMPQLSLATSSIVYPGAVININGDANGDISYTVNGDDPKTADPANLLYGNTYTVTAEYGETVSIKVYSSGDGYTPSATALYSYTVCEQEEYIMSIPSTDEVLTSGETVTLSSSVTNARIYYTTDGSNPTTSSAGGSATANITANGDPGDVYTIKALVATDGATPGNVQVVTYTMAEKTPAPTAQIPNNATLLLGAAVELTAIEGDIFYTTDGSDPTTSSAVYSGPIAVTSSIQLKAMALAEGKEPSEIVSYNYSMAGFADVPRFSKPSGTVEQNSSITLSVSTEGTTIYYSTDGTDPSSDNLDNLTLYSTPIVIGRAVTIKAIAVGDRVHASGIASATYTVVEPPAPVTDNGDDDVPRTTGSGMLESRRTFTNEDGGPQFDNVLSDVANNVVISSEDGVIDQEAQLKVTSLQPSQAQKDLAKAQGYDVDTLYELALEKDTVNILPDGRFEIGLPIDSAYQNSEVVILRYADDGTVEQIPVRRSGGIAYAIVDGMGTYAVGVPSQTSDNGFIAWIRGIIEWLELLL